MLREFLAGSNLLLWPIVGFLIFFVTFVAVLAYVALGKRRKHAFDRLASLPLDDDVPREGDPHPGDRPDASKRGGD